MSGESAGGSTIGVASLNVCCGLSNPLRPVRERAVEFCRGLEQAGPDVVNFQEVWAPGLLGFLRSRLPSYPHLARGAGAGARVLGHPVGGLASFSRTPLRSVEYTSFRGTRPRAGSGLFRSRAALGACLQGLLTFELAGRRTVVGNVHLSANRDGDWSAGNRYRGLQAGQLARVHQVLRRARREDTELVIASGDFNLASSSPLYAAAVDGGAWRDPFAAADLPTFHAALLPAGASAQRVDYLLLNGDPERYPVIATDRLFTGPAALPSGGSGFLSDHVAQLIRVTGPVGAPVSPSHG